MQQECEERETIIETRKLIGEIRDLMEIKINDINHPWVRQAFRNNIARLGGVIGDLGVSLVHFGRVTENDTLSERVAET